MKRILFLSITLVFSVWIFGQKQTLPSFDLQTLDGTTVNTADLLEDGRPVFLDFWATWCKPCIVELNTLAELYPDWEDETDVKIVVISVDDARTQNRVAPFVASRGWDDFTILLDPNSDFKRAMNVVNIPHSFIIAPDGTIVWQHTGFAPGDEEEIYAKLLELKQQLDTVNKKN